MCSYFPTYTQNSLQRFLPFRHLYSSFRRSHKGLTESCVTTTTHPPGFFMSFFLAMVTLRTSPALLNSCNILPQVTVKHQFLQQSTIVNFSHVSVKHQFLQQSTSVNVSQVTVKHQFLQQSMSVNLSEVSVKHQFPAKDKCKLITG